MRKLLIVLCLVFVVGSFGANSERIHRSAAARRHFHKENPCPSTGETSGRCPGYVIDHIIPLACGGPDEPGNMQWQTLEDAKEKDKVERLDCQNR